jgi:hypothetical protein
MLEFFVKDYRSADRDAAAVDGVGPSEAGQLR